MVEVRGKHKKIIDLVDIPSKSDEQGQDTRMEDDQSKILIPEAVQVRDDQIIEMDEVADNILYLYNK